MGDKYVYVYCGVVLNWPELASYKIGCVFQWTPNAILMQIKPEALACHLDCSSNHWSI
jgi:hypothetical protein